MCLESSCVAQAHVTWLIYPWLGWLPASLRLLPTMVCCPLCVAPPLALACSALGIQQTPAVQYAASGAGGAAMIGVAWLRRNGCGSKGHLRRLNLAGGAAMIAYAISGYSAEAVKGEEDCCCA